MVHSAGRKGAAHLKDVQLSSFADIGTDANGAAGAPVPEVFGVSGYFKFSDINGFYPAFSGNSHYRIGLSFHGQFIGASVRNCALGGDNATTIGLKLESDYGSYGIIEACEGSLVANAAKDAWKALISIVGSRFGPTNSAGANLSERNGAGFDISLTSPDQGKTANSGALRVLRALEDGRTATELELSPTAAEFGRPLRLRAGARILNGGSLSGGDGRDEAATWTIDSHTGAATFRELRIGDQASALSAISEPLGGRRLASGECERANVELKGARPATAVQITPLDAPDPGDAFFFRAYVAAADSVTVKVCALQAADLARSRYRVQLSLQP
jgi:hypothetical protein